MVASPLLTAAKSKYFARYQGILGSCVGLGNVIGPFLAAGYTLNASWRYSFFTIAPLALIEAVVLFFFLPPSTIPKEDLATKLRKIGYVGIFLSISGTILLLIPISGIGSQFSTSSPMVISMLTLGSVCLVLFFLNEWKIARLPMIPRRYRFFIAFQHAINSEQCDYSRAKPLLRC